MKKMFYYVVYFLNLMVFLAFFIRYTSSQRDTNAHLILQLVSIVIGGRLFARACGSGPKTHQGPFIRDLAIGYALRTLISNCGRSVDW